LTERSGRVVSRESLEGKVWIANFIFTRCGGPCPLLSERMAGLQKRMKSAGLRFVSFTVDPAYDTPDVLAAYAERYGADPERWLFLTGETESVYSIIREGFRLAASPNPQGKDGEQVVHNLNFVLVDEKGRIRGYYGGTDESELEKLRRDARRLS
jgi:protein SCO1